MSQKFEDIPKLLVHILHELKVLNERLNGHPGVDTVPFPETESDTNTAIEPETKKDSYQEKPEIDKTSLKNLCLKISRDMPGAKPKIKEILAAFNAKKVADLDDADFPKALSQIQELANAS